MLSQHVLTLAREDKKIILALLTHPRLISLRREFQERVCDVLGDEREFDRLSQFSDMPPDLLGDRTRRGVRGVECEFEESTSGGTSPWRCRRSWWMT